MLLGFQAAAIDVLRIVGLYQGHSGHTLEAQIESNACLIRSRSGLHAQSTYTESTNKKQSLTAEEKVATVCPKLV